MRNLQLLSSYRLIKEAIDMFGWAGDESNGVFNVPSPTDNATLTIIASNGGGWDHVSVSRKNRCPNWTEMECIRRLFFKEDETVIQFHVPVADHVNFHSNCLHLWRPQNAEIPRPPSYMVGPKEAA